MYKNAQRRFSQIVHHAAWLSFWNDLVGSPGVPQRETVRFIAASQPHAGDVLNAIPMRYPVRTECGHACGGQDLQTNFFILIFPLIPDSGRLTPCTVHECVDSYLDHEDVSSDESRVVRSHTHTRAHNTAILENASSHFSR